MSKLLCDCGYIIVDQTDDLEYKAYFVIDQDSGKIFERSKTIADFIKASLDNKRNEWLDQFFGTAIYHSLDDESVISDILSKYELLYESVMYSCDNCGRLFIQKGRENRYLKYTPEANYSSEKIFKKL